MFQRLSCGFYALYPSLACSKFAQVFQRLLHSFFFFALYCASLLGIYCQVALYRWEGMAASTNCSSNVNCCATLRTYLVHREQRSTMTEELLLVQGRHLADAHAPANGHLHTRVRHGSLASDAPANDTPTYAHARWIARVSFSLVFTPYLWNAVVSGKSPRLYPSSRCSQPVGATYWPPRSL